MTEKEAHPKVLIEDWFPYEEVGIECQRERGISSTLPPLNRIHVWWARRPLSVSKAAILASILPKTFKTNDFAVLIGYSEGIKAEYKNIQEANKKNEKLTRGFEKKRSFKQNLSEKQRNLIKKEINDLWGKENIVLLDPMAGGGSIPFESVRLGLSTISSDINPVACVLQYASIKYPQIFGNGLIKKIQQLKQKILDQSQDLLNFYPKTFEKEFDAFLWVRTVKCSNPSCELEVPLSPNWDLAKKPLIILELVIPNDIKQKKCRFKVIEKPTKEQLKKNMGTVKGGAGICPRCKSTLDSAYIKKEAQARRMGHQLMAVVYKESQGTKKGIRKFRAPNEDDDAAIVKVDSIIGQKIIEWKEKGILPDTDVPDGSDNRPNEYGIDKWYKFFNNRQLLANLSILEKILNLKKAIQTSTEIKTDEINAIITYFQLALDKVFDYNCIATRWHSGRGVIANKFDRHDFAFKWSYAEMDIIRKGFDWAIKIVLDRFLELSSLLTSSSSQLTIFNNNAQALHQLNDLSVDVIVVDPPYYDNVMYAELSDFFYVWMRITLQDIFPSFFNRILTDKDNEAVANSSRFENLGSSKKVLAKQDYEAKMRACFIEMHRILQVHGVLTIMFTHKATDAWDTLAMSLMNAGFEITASWPVSTESEYSLHIAKKNAVQTTILLVCRKRLFNVRNVWWEDDVLPKIKDIVKQKSAEFQKSGIDGVDLFITVFGPALHEFSKYYPVKDISGNEVRPERALNVAREIVTDIIYKKIIKSTSTSIDLISKFYLIAWHLYKAREFPFDEARNLALSIGLNVEDLKSIHKILNKKAGDVELISPRDREKQGFLNLEKPNDNGILINAVHLALLAYQEGGKRLSIRWFPNFAGMWTSLSGNIWRPFTMPFPA